MNRIMLKSLTPRPSIEGEVNDIFCINLHLVISLLKTPVGPPSDLLYLDPYTLLTSNESSCCIIDFSTSILFILRHLHEHEKSRVTMGSGPRPELVNFGGGQCFVQGCTCQAHIGESGKACENCDHTYKGAV